MQNVIDYFQSMPSYQRSLLLAGGVVVLWILEGATPLFAFKHGTRRHALINIALTVLQLLIGLAFASLIVNAADYVTEHRLGLLHLVDAPLWIDVVAGVMLLDLIAAYWSHRIEHQVRWMWKFHLIHHTDTEVDVTTGLRHHPGETIIRSLFSLLAVVIVGTPVGVFILYQSLSVLFAQIEHANVRVPDRLDRAVSLLLVTPNMHKVHHHYVQPLTDTNYGNIFSVWDRLFGTFACCKPELLRYGIDTHLKPEEHSNFVNLLKIPFQPYRPPSGSKFGSDE